MASQYAPTPAPPAPAPAPMPAPAPAPAQKATDNPIVGPQIGAGGAGGGLGGRDIGINFDPQTDQPVTPSPGNMTPSPLPNNPVTNPITSTGSSPNNAGGTGLTLAQVMNYWIQAGGNPQAAAMAAAVADASSGLNAAAQRTNPDGTTSVGLWLIPANGTPPGSTDPLANATAAVQLSQNGTDWTQWCVAWSDNDCGQQNGTYLGQGSNALMALQSGNGGSYNVFGSTPAGSGVGASSATSGTSTNTTTSSSKSIILIFVVIALGVGLWYFSRRRSQAQSSAGQNVPVNDPSNTGDVYVPAHVRHRSGQ